MTASTPAAARTRRQHHTDELRFLTCGSVDDGKSTLIGRLLYESKLLPSDHLAALEADSRRAGTRGGELDFALLVDGLAAEREQGITIDVAYRFFATERRRFVVADTPGHEQYTRNMVTGASNAEAAVVLLDARTGVLTQTRRHARLLALLGIRHVALAVNKLDLVGYSRSVFEKISGQFREFAAGIGLDDVTCIPTSAVHGDNVTARSDATPWYGGPTLLGWLESVEPAAASGGPARFLVQWVNRPEPGFRGYSGQVVRGRLRRGDRVRVAPGNIEATVGRIVTMDGDLDEATRGMATTVMLDDDVDVSRGDVLAAAGDPVDTATAFQAHLVWLDEREMLPGRQYLAKLGASTVGLTVETPKYRVDVDSGNHLPARTLRRDEIAVANVHLDTEVAYEPYRTASELGSFIVLDRLGNATAGAGMIDFALRRSATVRWQSVTVDKNARSARNGHRPCVVWFTGLSGAGKSTIADLVEKALHAQGRHTFLLDGDNVRHGLNKDLGFTDADRVENIRRIGEVAALMVDAGLIVLASFISPFRQERALARGLVEPGEFCEVHVDAPLEHVERRDPKGLYARARRGELANFTGIDSPYEPPERPEIRLDTTALTAEQAAEEVLARLRETGVLRGS
ncbi:adenylyl-sulfate kinase [Haloechinothrix sp. LS1_15]|uniref:adenylyl-sulfate kinase n=1 Tax=Haloechinothrix sp. LS1_15 TaxID=2652248 RepID=UPI002944D0A3|nr:adenylyl-sulfate kinase [Haloechinothrix sp. LS1_15]MDV6011677.1 adenylyl-sulfate kinase [Haloechinothrix sp. LS1_15]